ncbi:hypothetical protein B0A55_09834 [Friedmanniomyces simplex]|uniref:Uncharacterized protein n=1 Tax=Friedmanniomyces simplex TaxID=329884 RepID=A0A4U0X053_9PEZI|nr:hypothetical protein B0A55_09834 [Friedmanniomyces simplex]
MPPSQKFPPFPQNPSISPRSSAAPLLPLDQQQADGGEFDGITKETDSQTEKRRLLGLGKKPEEKDTRNMDATAGGLLPQTQAAIAAMKPDTKARPQAIPVSPSRHPYPSGIAASPSRLRSSSPRLYSPASSEIFERNVQEPVPMSTLQGEDTPAHIPTHVMTEDHIPPALEATANAITSNSLNADEVEIVTSSSHQPAAEKVLEASVSHADLTQLQPPPLKHAESASSDIVASTHHLPTHPEDDGASNYGQLDPNDVRRLSFISFADVMQSEHQQQAASSLGDIGSRDSLHISSLSGSFPSVHERAASPFRSPRSPGSMSGGVTTPPGVSVDSAHEQSPPRSNVVGALASPPGQHGELTIETMRQAVRKTASGDLSGVRSPAAMSPLSDEPSMRETRSRTNT